MRYILIFFFLFGCRTAMVGNSSLRDKSSQSFEENLVEDENYLSMSLLIKGTLYVDPLSHARSQGMVGSCQSFAFLGAVENKLYVKRGVSIDLSERYQLFANFAELGRLGNSSADVTRLPSIAETMGFMPEDLYPYTVVSDNSAVFNADSAQGLENAKNRDSIEFALAGKSRTERIGLLQDPRFLGPLPEVERPVTIPVAAHTEFATSTRILRDKISGKEVSCFSVPGSTPTESLKLSPSEFAHHCLEYRASDFEPKGFISQINKNRCTEVDGVKSLTRDFFSFNKKEAQLIASRLDRGYASVVGFPVPEQKSDKVGVLWSADMDVEAGHAVVALGYLSADDFTNERRHVDPRNYWQIFDQMANAHDKSYHPPSASLSTSDQMKVRSGSRLGSKIVNEGGAFLIRNSWGERVGSEGYQFVTANYLNLYMFLHFGIDVNNDNTLIRFPEPSSQQRERVHKTIHEQCKDFL